MGLGISLDKLSFILVVLVLIFAIISSLYCVGDKGVLNFVLLVFLLFSLLNFFFSGSFWKLFIWFELSVLIMFYFVLVWGSNPERLQSVGYFLTYSLVGSFPLLFSLSCVSQWQQLDNFFFSFYTLEENYYGSVVFSLFLIIGFIIKIPVFGLHWWLPKVHVEASVLGSVALAGVFLKMGVYGLFCVSDLVDWFIYFPSVDGWNCDYTWVKISSHGFLWIILYY